MEGKPQQGSEGPKPLHQLPMVSGTAAASQDHPASGSPEQLPLLGSEDMLPTLTPPPALGSDPGDQIPPTPASEAPSQGGYYSAAPAAAAAVAAGAAAEGAGEGTAVEVAAHAESSLLAATLAASAFRLNIEAAGGEAGAARGEEKCGEAMRLGLASSAADTASGAALRPAAADPEPAAEAVQQAAPAFSFPLLAAGQGCESPPAGLAPGWGPATKPTLAAGREGEEQALRLGMLAATEAAGGSCSEGGSPSDEEISPARTKRFLEEITEKGERNVWDLFLVHLPAGPVEPLSCGGYASQVWKSCMPNSRFLAGC
jgi:hypothetical protein